MTKITNHQMEKNKKNKFKDFPLSIKIKDPYFFTPIFINLYKLTVFN